MHTLQKISQWEEYFAEVGLQPDVASRHLKVAERQLAAGVPVIFDLEHLGKLLGVSDAYLASVMMVTNHHYRTFEIQKRSGGSREISSPRLALKNVQRWILENIFYALECHPAAVGFCRKKSIVDHARKHFRASTILKLDVANFFPSIRLNRVIGIFQGLGYSDELAFALARICCLNDRLPQGAVTSPTLSNLVCRRLDMRLSRLAKRSRMRYSRYADDMAFSGRNISASYISVVEKILKEEGFLLRKQKTRLYGEASKRVLTGLSVALSGVNLVRSDRRELRATFHQIRKFGLLSFISNNKVRDPLFVDRIIGKFAFWRFVRPDDEFVHEAVTYLIEQKKALGIY